ncbi:MAG: N-acetylmuramoyl-L-alanine amidase [Actinomyces sp.]|nr:peptidoglycan recognition family protein [Actinomyces sp.]MCI1788754.1 N-acetylmuramoyl-L-alanine amidase [Actinomyces sp.]MCI1831145.1 N-acetylmuramoyl-L-alanine amidase [Actinomyces sp.]
MKTQQGVITKGTEMSFTVYSGKTPKFYTPDREREIDSIVIHHWGAKSSYQGMDDLSAMRSIENGFAAGGREASAHYIVASGKVMQVLHDKHTAWHAGDWVMNTRSIGIECHPRCSSGDLNTVAELVQILATGYGPLHLYGHSDVITSGTTACPGDYYPNLGPLRAIALNPENGPFPVDPAPAVLAVDGYWGVGTTTRLQEVLGTTRDGAVSSQDSFWKNQNPGLTSGWEWVASSSAVGSQLIKSLQRKCSVSDDGLIGPGTIKAIQRRMGTTADGTVSEQSKMVMEMQRRLNRNTI